MDQACRWVIEYFSFLLGNAVPNDDIIVTSVKMPFTEEDEHAIKILREEKQYSSRRLLNEFPSKNWTRHGLDHLIILFCKLFFVVSIHL